MTESRKQDTPDMPQDRVGQVKNLKVDESGFHASYYKRARAGLETMLATMQRPALAQALKIIEEGINKNDENQDLYFDWQKAVTVLQTLLSVRDRDTALLDIAKSPVKLEALLNAGSRTIALVSGRHQSPELKQVEDVVKQLSETAERLTMLKHPATMTTIQEWHKKRDEKKIAEARQNITGDMPA